MAEEQVQHPTIGDTNKYEVKMPPKPRIKRPDFVNSEKLRKAYPCELCHQILLEPQLTECGSRACLACILEKFGDKKTICCPFLHADWEFEELKEASCQINGLKREEIYTDYSCQRELAKELCYCPNRYCGCPKVIEYLLLKEHVDECKYSPKTLDVDGSSLCNDGDSNKGSSAQMVRCRYCDELVEREEIEAHEAICKKGRTKCEDCNREFERPRQLAVHKRIHPPCITEGGKCYYYDTCFMEAETAEELKQHMIDCLEQHLYCVTFFAQAFEEETKEANEGAMARLHEDLQSRKKPFERKVMSLATRIKDLQRRMEESRTCDYRLLAMISMMQSNGSDIQKLERSVDQIYDDVKAAGLDRVTRIDSFQEQINTNNAAISLINSTLNDMDEASYNGNLLWKITDFQRKKSASEEADGLSFQSPFIHTSKYGYRLVARIFLYGPMEQKSPHISLFLALHSGLYDNLLEFPFRQVITVTLISPANPRYNRVHRLSTANKSSIMNKPLPHQANPGFGPQRFIDHADLESNYIHNDTLYIKIEIAPGAPSFI